MLKDPLFWSIAAPVNMVALPAAEHGWASLALNLAIATALSAIVFLAFRYAWTHWRSW